MTANSSVDTVSVLRGSGLGTFAVKVDHATGAYPVEIVAGDLNGDGKLDLATANAGADTVSVLIGSGNNTFTHTPDAAPRNGVSSATGLALGDMNGDGNEDLIVVSPDGRYTTGFFGALFGVGDGSFSRWGTSMATAIQISSRQTSQTTE